jgi:UDP-N-acetylmuramate--alanine ligase
MQNIHEQNPIDWYVYSSAVAIEHPDSPEIKFCKEHVIKTRKRDGLINEILNERQLKRIAIAGTHGKSTTTAMTIWLFQVLAIPIS